jgi:hypothetical protein
MPERNLRISVRRLARLFSPTGFGSLQAAGTDDHGEHIEAVEHEDVAAVLELRHDGTLSIRLFGEHGACPLKSALVRLETPDGTSLTGRDARTNDEGCASLTVAQRSQSQKLSDCFLIITMPAAGE